MYTVEVDKRNVSAGAVYIENFLRICFHVHVHVHVHVIIRKWTSIYYCTCTCTCILAPLQDKVAAFQKVSTMYIKYVLTFRKLEECYDQIVHPQKRRLIRHMLDGTIGRYMYMNGKVKCGNDLHVHTMYMNKSLNQNSLSCEQL